MFQLSPGHRPQTAIDETTMGLAIAVSTGLPGDPVSLLDRTGTIAPPHDPAATLADIQP